MLIFSFIPSILATAFVSSPILGLDLNCQSVQSILHQLLQDKPYSFSHFVGLMPTKVLGRDIVGHVVFTFTIEGSIVA
jgi:hypothetical protein